MAAGSESERVLWLAGGLGGHEDHVLVCGSLAAGEAVLVSR